jgi:hypothetical protein
MAGVMSAPRTGLIMRTDEGRISSQDLSTTIRRIHAGTTNSEGSEPAEMAFKYNQPLCYIAYQVAEC